MNIICSLIFSSILPLNKSHTCWWYGWSRVCRWPRERTRPWAGTTWWKSGCRRGRWWTICRQMLNPRRRSIPACTAAANKRNKHQGWIQLHDHRCKNTGSCLFWGWAGGKKQVSCVTSCCFVQTCLCRTITAAAAKTQLSEAEKHVLGKWQFAI